MKKSLLICLLAVVLCVSMLFAACAPSLEAETLEAMKNMLYQMYRNGNPTSNYEVVGVVAAQGKTANIQWSVKVTSGDQNAVKVGSYDEESKKVTIEVDPEPKADVAYTLTATLTDEKGKAYEIDGQPASISFERSLKEFKVNTYAEYLAACQANSGAGSDEQIRIKGYVIGVVCMSSSSKGSLYIQDADGHGYYAYNPVDATKDCETDAQLRAKWPIGTEVYVTGTVTTYNGQYEFNKGCEVRKTGNTVTDAELPYVDATSAFAAATSNEDTALAEYQNRRVTLKDAIVTKIDVTGTKGTSDYKAYYYFTLPGSDVEFNVYYTIYFIDDATASAVCDKLVVGKKVDLSGIISVYSKDFQVYPDSANSVSNVRDVEYTDAEKVAIAKQNLALDSAITEPKSIDLPATGDLGTTITWAFAEGTTADFIAIADGKLTVSALPDSTTEVTVIATITSGSVSETKEFKVNVAASLVMSETRAYAGYVNQVKASKELYLDGGVSGRYLTTTTNASKAVAVYAEKATGGYKFYI
ncbi:MAG: OB-fold nucleic acid binding domain-containing protein, partial [Clostridia bacterium]|nr:OB-fold nucleic acid binding domain-containing protein [Clostridia bacterium]